MNYKNNLKSFSKMLIVTFAIVSLVGGTSPFGLVSVAEAGNRGNSSPQKTQSQKSVKKPAQEVKKPDNSKKKESDQKDKNNNKKGKGGKKGGDNKNPKNSKNPTPPVTEEPETPTDPDEPEDQEENEGDEEVSVIEDETSETPVKSTKRSGRAIPQTEVSDVPEGQVLGVATEEVATCGQYLTSYLRFGYNNDAFEVTKLQLFLTAQGFAVEATGEFDLETDKAVRDFQLAHMEDVLTPWGESDSTGYVYKTTKWKINNIVCPLSEVFPTPLI